MENLNSTELKVFNLIRSGKSRNEIIAENFATAASVQVALSGIYSKTEDVMTYHTARNKFEELACFVRNNPEVFKHIPEIEVPDEKENEKEIAWPINRSELAGFQGPVKSDETITLKVKKVIDKISTKLQAKLEILDEVYTEIEKELSDENNV